jgi:hypothetical protein
LSSVTGDDMPEKKRSAFMKHTLALTTALIGSLAIPGYVGSVDEEFVE